MKKWLIGILLSTFILCVLSACGGADETSSPASDAAETNSNGETEAVAEEQESGEPVEIEFWHAMSGPHEEAINEFAERFNSEHDNITVKPVNQGGYNDLEQKVMAAARAQSLPTIAQAVTSVIPEYIANGFVAPLNDWMEDPEVGLSDDELNDYVEIFRESSIWYNTFYSLPFSKSTRVLFYNQGILEENGLDVPSSWEDIRHISETVTGDGLIGMGFENSFESEFQALLIQMGGVYIDEGTLEAQFASTEGIEAMSLMKELMDEGLARTAGEDDYMSNPFGRGDVAMYIGSSAGIPHVASAAEGNIEWSTTVLPAYEGEAATSFAGNDIVLFNQADEAEQRAAWEFMKFLTSPEITAEWSMKSGYLPVRYSAEDLEDYQAFVAENPEYLAGPSQFDAGFFVARVKGSDAVRNILLEEFDNILVGNKSVEEGLTDAQNRANSELENQ
ncbi:multiple sugar transport system substrate-binding protein [Evansella caseinilytica]|uniref:Multiple sugar transport system substrate-binding protein n=1 Tax=Evansella caseinilytica TaxID=1503961 RepID=A0A1H3SL13_9BACI|nr:ABC transporter substrate-binding protein [Evansella caseinilytica]SDZ38696.1 multiple sugar transport system substrate-binding protein [Evansella caseinilytica]